MQPVDEMAGFTLLELLIGITLTGLLVLGTSTFFASVYGAVQQTQRGVLAEMTLAQTGHWIFRTFAHDGLGASDLIPQFENPGCFLVGEHGVRLRAGQLQWRPQNRGCEESGWLALHDAAQLHVETITWQSPFLCFTGRAASSKTPTFVWCSPWPHSIRG